MTNPWLDRLPTGQESTSVSLTFRVRSGQAVRGTQAEMRGALQACKHGSVCVCVCAGRVVGGVEYCREGPPSADQADSTTEIGSGSKASTAFRPVELRGSGILAVGGEIRLCGSGKGKEFSREAAAPGGDDLRCGDCGRPSCLVLPYGRWGS